MCILPLYIGCFASFLMALVGLNKAAGWRTHTRTSAVHLTNTLLSTNKKSKEQNPSRDDRDPIAATPLEQLNESKTLDIPPSRLHHARRKRRSSIAKGLVVLLPTPTLKYNTKGYGLGNRLCLKRRIGS